MSFPPGLFEPAKEREIFFFFFFGGVFLRRANTMNNALHSSRATQVRTISHPEVSKDKIESQVKGWWGWSTVNSVNFYSVQKNKLFLSY